MSNKIDAMVLTHVLGLPVPPPRTYREAERLNTSTASCFAATAVGWIAYIDWADVEREKLHDCPVEWEPEHSYSTEIDAAWAVVEEWGVLPWSIDNGWREKDGERLSGVTCKVTTHTDSFEATEKDAPLAICVCALRAKGVPESEIQEALQ